MSYLSAQHRQSDLLNSASSGPHQHARQPSSSSSSFGYPPAADSLEGGDMMSGPSRGGHFHHPGSPYGVGPQPGHRHMASDPSLGMAPTDPGSRYYYDARQGLAEGGPASPDRPAPSYVAATQFGPHAGLPHAYAHPHQHPHPHPHPHGSPVQHSPNPDFRARSHHQSWGSPAPSTPSYMAHRPPHGHMSPAHGLASPQMDDLHRGWNARPAGASILGKRPADHQLISDRQGAAPSPVMYGGVPSGLPHPNSASSTEESMLRQQQQHGGWGALPPRHDGQDPGRSRLGASPGADGQGHHRASSSPSASSAHAAGAASTSATPAHSSSVRHPPPNTQGGNQPSLVRTSQIPPTPSAGPPQNSFAAYSNKAMLKIHGDLSAMTTGWSPEEWTARRRLVQFTRWQDSHTINVQFRSITLQEFQPSSIVISCIYREERNECYVTSVDTIYLLEALIGTRFTVEEKNRIRRNLEGFKPQTVSKSKPESEAFFKLIMMYPNPRPRNIEKDVKVFPWRILPSALRKIVGKYSATYGGAGDGAAPAGDALPPSRDDDGAPASASSVQGLLDGAHVGNEAGPSGPGAGYDYQPQTGSTRPPSIDFSSILASHPYDPVQQFGHGHAVGGSEDGGSYDAAPVGNGPAPGQAGGAPDTVEGDGGPGSAYGQAGHREATTEA